MQYTFIVNIACRFTHFLEKLLALTWKWMVMKADNLSKMPSLSISFLAGSEWQTYFGVN